MKSKLSKKDYLNGVFVRNGKFYKVFEVDLDTETILFRNLEKDEVIIRETFKRFDENYKHVMKTI